MDAHYGVQPDLIENLASLPSFTITREALPQIRAGLLQMLAQSAQENPLIEQSEQRVPRSGGDIRLVIQRPKAVRGPLPAILHLHGGGLLLGAPEMSLAANAELALALGCVVATVQYRLAPEHPYPAAIEDAYGALKWLHTNAASLNIKPDRIAISGESAGGNLAAAVTLRMRDSNEVPLCYQMLVYPMLDDRTGRTRAASQYVGRHVWTAENNKFSWDAYLAGTDEASRAAGYAVPGRAANLANLPATFIAVGALDLFAAEDLEFAKRLVEAGVPTELHLYPGAYHGFDLVKAAHVTRRFHSDRLTGLRRALAD